LPIIIPLRISENGIQIYASGDSGHQALIKSPNYLIIFVNSDQCIAWLLSLSLTFWGGHTDMKGGGTECLETECPYNRVPID
jgi:hypothetical protein